MYCIKLCYNMDIKGGYYMIKLDNTRTVDLEQLIAGALLRFQILDNVDISLLIRDLAETKEIDVKCYNQYYEQFGKYIDIHRNGCITLKDNITLNTLIEDDNCTLKEKIMDIVDGDIKKFFEMFDIEEYKNRKFNYLEEQKKLLLEKATILLISDAEEDYDALVKYGFKNIDFFKSIIRADKYFKENPDEFDKYVIILEGHQSATKCCFGGNVDLIDRLYRTLDNESIIYTPYSIYSHSGDFVALFSDYKNRRCWEVKEKSYDDLFDRLIQCASINQILDKVSNKEFKPIQDYINPNKLELPTKKSDLKILYLDSVEVSDFANDIANELGLNVTFKEDNNYSLGRFVKSYLGDYDIIIVSDTYSSSILGMNNESTEQCKDTGRNLTLLVTYNKDIIWQFYYDYKDEFDYQGIGDKINLKYIFGGNVASNSGVEDKEYRVLRQAKEAEEIQSLEKYRLSAICGMRSILEEALNIYNNALLESQNLGLCDFDFKSAEEYDNEYAKAEEAIKLRRQLELQPIRDFDSLSYNLSCYLNYKKKGLVPSRLDGIKIRETKDGIYVENIYNNRVLCAITISKKKSEENLRVFSIQTTTKKGNLGEPQMTGLYTHKFEALENIPDRPNENQMNALKSLYKKVNFVVVPLNKEACNKQYNLQEKENQKQKINKRNRKYKQKI